ncbi:MAG: PEP-CTERM sorting domain-containing protein [Pirellulales bacterium]|nr:PEP-CTERM sorting domain-containing protein [Pirellulales bacterium]
MADRWGTRIAFALAGCVALACCGPAQAVVLGHWLFDENGGITVADSSGNGYDGTLNNLLNPNPNAGQYEGQEGWTVGAFNFGGYPLDNNPNGAAVATTTLRINELSARSFTLEAIVTNNSMRRTWSPFFNADQCCFFFGKSATAPDTLHFNLAGIGSGSSGEVPIADGNPHHIAMVFDNVKNTVKMYFDHELVGYHGRMEGTINTTTWLDKFLTLGGGVTWTTVEKWDGLAYEARITVDEVLTPDDFLAVPSPILPPTATGSTWEYTSFTDMTGLRARGSAGIIPGDKMRLTSETLSSQAGAVWRHGAVKFANDLTFSTSFSFDITRTTTGAVAADGMLFVIQDEGSDVNGWSGGNMGIPLGGELGAPVTKYVAVEMDTYPNGLHDRTADKWPGDHLAIDASGATLSLAEFGDWNDLIGPYSFTNGGTRYVWVDYNGGTQIMDVYYSDTDTKPGSPLLSYNFASLYAGGLAEHFGGNTNLYVGFVGATGSLYQNNDLLSWTFETIPDSIEPPPGDADRDGDVDKDDAALLAANWLTSGASWSQGDFNDDGLVDDLDLAILAANWGTGVPAGAAVPEPSVLALLAGLGLLWALRRRK